MPCLCYLQPIGGLGGGEGGAGPGGCLAQLAKHSLTCAFRLQGNAGHLVVADLLTHYRQGCIILTSIMADCGGEPTVRVYDSSVSRFRD